MNLADQSVKRVIFIRNDHYVDQFWHLPLFVHLWILPLPKVHLLPSFPSAVFLPKINIKISYTSGEWRYSWATLLFMEIMVSHILTGGYSESLKLAPSWRVTCFIEGSKNVTIQQLGQKQRKPLHVGISLLSCCHQRYQLFKVNGYICNILLSFFKW